tara:strand:- start:4813 stop:5094 length:282 start_codon:yes stop_codon:yes gene_type:complete
MGTERSPNPDLFAQLKVEVIMSASTIYIKTRGIPIRGACVTLAYKEGGMSGTLTTDNTGKATINHIASGPAEVIVNGHKSAIITLPCTCSVEL